MKQKRYTDEQFAFALRQAEAGTRVDEICRKLGVSEQTFYRWKQFSGMGVTEIRRLKPLEDSGDPLEREEAPHQPRELTTRHFAIQAQQARSVA